MELGEDGEVVVVKWGVGEEERVEGVWKDSKYESITA